MELNPIPTREELLSEIKFLREKIQKLTPLPGHCYCCGKVLGYNKLCDNANCVLFGREQP